ncbi:MAG: hypothetical protein M0C28_38000 [Candidatus Moduliflexus flocculans]|nr:hypothetical protein [Candidatus Moduliflexus flocculans]
MFPVRNMPLVIQVVTYLDPGEVFPGRAPGHHHQGCRVPGLLGPGPDARGLRRIDPGPERGPAPPGVRGGRRPPRRRAS